MKYNCQNDISNKNADLQHSVLCYLIFTWMKLSAHSKNLVLSALKQICLIFPCLLYWMVWWLSSFTIFSCLNCCKTLFHTAYCSFIWPSFDGNLSYRLVYTKSVEETHWNLQWLSVLWSFWWTQIIFNFKRILTFVKIQDASVLDSLRIF